jgi:hypothetical protein
LRRYLSLDLPAGIVYAEAMTTNTAQTNYINLLIKSGQKPKFETTHFGKPYIWFVDPETNHWYMERLPDPEPVAYSIDATTGETVPVYA